MQQARHLMLNQDMDAGGLEAGLPFDDWPAGEVRPPPKTSAEAIRMRRQRARELRR